MSLTAPRARAARAGADRRCARAHRAGAVRGSRSPTAPHAFEFYQVMRLLEALHPRPPALRPQRPARRRTLLRLAQEPSVTHAPASLAGYEPGEDGRPDRLLVHFFGLFGPDGPLPLHLTEYARDRRRNQHDPTFAALRRPVPPPRAVAVLPRLGRCRARPSASTGRSRTGSAPTSASLIGLGTRGLRDRDAMPDLTKLHFAGHLANQTRHAEGLARSCRRSSTMPVRVESFVGAWLTPAGRRLHAARRRRARPPRSANPPCSAAGSGAGSTSSASCSAR